MRGHGGSKRKSVSSLTCSWSWASKEPREPHSTKQTHLHPHLRTRLPNLSKGEGNTFKCTGHWFLTTSEALSLLAMLKHRRHKWCGFSSIHLREKQESSFLIGFLGDFLVFFHRIFLTTTSTHTVPLPQARAWVYVCAPGHTHTHVCMCNFCPSFLRIFWWEAHFYFEDSILWPSFSFDR